MIFIEIMMHNNVLAHSSALSCYCDKLFVHKMLVVCTLRGLLGMLLWSDLSVSSSCLNSISKSHKVLTTRLLETTGLIRLTWSGLIYYGMVSVAIAWK